MYKSYNLTNDCYNESFFLFLSRTDLEFEYNDGSNALKFDFDAFAAFDIFILKRENAQKDYSTEQLERAERFFARANQEAKNKLVDTVIKGLPGRTSEAYTMDSFKNAVGVMQSTF